MFSGAQLRFFSLLYATAISLTYFAPGFSAEMPNKVGSPLDPIPKVTKLTWFMLRELPETFTRVQVPHSHPVYAMGIVLLE